MKVSATTAFGEGFRILGREPLTVLGWAVANVVYIVALFAVMFGLFAAVGLSVGGLSSMQPGRFPSGAIGGFVLIILVLLLLGCLFYGVMSAAIYRAVLDPGGSRQWARLRLGGTEFRLALNLIFQSLLWIVWYIGTIIVMGIVVAIGGRSGLGVVLAIPLVVFSMLAFFSLFAFGGPMTFDRGGIQTFGAVGPAAGKFWSLVLLNLLLCLLGFVLYLVIAVLVISVLFGGSLGSLTSGDPTAMMNRMAGMYSSPLYYLVQLTLGPIISVAVQTVFMAPAARAYADAMGDRGNRAADTFA